MLSNFLSIIRKSFIDETKINKNQDQSFADALSSHIDDCLKKFRNSADEADSHYGPFLNLVQSNWTGKSRVCWDMANKSYILYISVGNENGFPYRSSNSLYFLNNSRTLSEQRRHFIDFINTFIYIVNYEQPSHQEFFNTYSNNTKNGLLDFNVAINERRELIKKKLDGLISDSSNRDDDERVLEIRSGDDEASKKKLIFVFDNYSELLKVGPRDSQKSMFSLFRSVLAKVNKKHCSYFALFIDSINKHEQLEVNEIKTRKKLFEPIYMLPTWDLFNDMISINNIFDTVKIENVMCYGRPLWGSYLKVKQFFDENSLFFCDECFEYLKREALSKLLANSPRPIDVENLTEEDLLAIISARVGMIRPNSFTMRQDLVFQHLAICSCIDQSKNMFECFYPSEPFLAMVAAECMNLEYYTNNDDQVETRLWSNVIENITNLFERSAIDLGDKSELLIKLIFLLAVDESCRRTFVKFPDNEHCYLKAIKVKVFIEVLFGQTGIDLIEQQLSNDDTEKLLNGYINFNHFMSTHQTDMKDYDIESMIKRCVALHCDRADKSVDLVIPVCLAKDNISKSKMSVIFVQLNALKKEIDLNDVNLDMIEPTSTQNPFLSLYFDLKSQIDKEIYVLNNGKNLKNRAIIYSSGIKFVRLFDLFCNGNICNNLIKLRNSKVKIDQKFQSILNCK